MSTVQTSARLLEAFSAAAKRTLSESEIRAQRVSFIMGAVDQPSITKAEVQKVVDQFEGHSNE